VTIRTLVIVPCKNLESHVGNVVRAIDALGLGLDVLVVNDGSTDQTTSKARTAGAEVVEHAVNMGKGVALKTGFDYALEHGYEAVITMDGDEQHDAATIPGFLKALESGQWDVVVGSRMSEVKDMPGIRIWTNQTTSRVISLLARQSIPDSQSGYRIIRTTVLKGMELVTKRYDTESEILIRAGRRGFRIGSIPIESIYTDGISHINPVVDTLRFLRLVWRSLFWR
jgi:glycosyltransferase involved in cell wall biosynthesis